MKKVFIILFLFFSCYIIYDKTSSNKLNYLSIGDDISAGINEYGVKTGGYNKYVKEYLKNKKILNKYNDDFSSKDKRIIDINNALNYNEKINNVSLNRHIKEADIITLSLGMNEIYNKIYSNNQNIYTYIDNMIKSYENIFIVINKFQNKKVYVLGYYNIWNNYNDIYNYANLKLKKLCYKYNFKYINLSNIFNNNPIYFNKKNSFIPNDKGYLIISQKIVEKIKNS